MIFVRELNESLHQLLETDPRVVVLGEDIADPYGGAFRATRGLTTAFPDRVLTTPVSEGAIAGVAAGLALSGYRPVVEIMFGDFVTLTFDQVVNHIAKYGAMYDGKATCPVIIRTPSGGHRGYGPTHSQSLEKHFLGVPHLTVAAASIHHGPGETLSALLQRDEPALYVEHKLLYAEHVVRPADNRVNGALGHQEATQGFLPTVVTSQVPREDCTVSVLAYGYAALLAERALEELAVEEEIFGELLIPNQIAPMDWVPVEASVAQTGSLLTVEEGTADWSWGTEAATEIGRRLFGELRQPVRVVASEPTVIPSSREQERGMLVGPERIKSAIREAAA